MANIDQAIQNALNQVGKPYVFGKSGPTSFDCSGLISYAFGLIGVKLPHNAAQQQKLVQKVSKEAARPGDLVFYGYPAHHVAMYLGDGKQVAAPHSGTNVQVQKVSSAATYGRVAGVGLGQGTAVGAVSNVANQVGGTLQNASFSVDGFFKQAQGVTLQLAAVSAGALIVGLGLWALVGRKVQAGTEQVMDKTKEVAGSLI